ncbi:MAG: glutamine amidotransferase [Clostridia bacterium]|nr:glutamine amidotransferase [Clostridia bacterium]
MSYTLNIGHFYPELLNLYGDKGNVTALKKRVEWRNMEVNVIEISENDEIDFNSIDIAVIGGGSEKELLTVLKKLQNVSADLKSYVESSGVVLAVCGGFEMLGESLFLNGKKEKGLGVLNMHSEQGSKRFTGNVVAETDFGKIVGFENHSGRTYIENNAPLGTVVCGNGNNGEDKKEGVVYKNLFGTYLHGALLPKNPELADEIILRALKRKYGEDIKLAPLDDSCEERAKQYIVDLCR